MNFFQVKKNENICEQFQSVTGSCASKMVKPLDSFLVCKIVTLREIGLSYNQIKEKLGLKSRSTAQSAYKRFLKTSSYSPKKPPGRPEKLSKKYKRLIIRSVKNDPKTTLQRIRVKYNSFATSKSVSRSTIRRVLKKYGLVSRVAAKKFQLNKKQRTTRKKWCLRMSKKPLGFLSSLALTEKST